MAFNTSCISLDVILAFFRLARGNGDGARRSFETFGKNGVVGQS